MTSAKIPPVLLLRLLFLLSFGAIIYGHIAVMVSGTLFDKVNRESYNLHSRWVSDFAAKWPEGTWVKVGILITCVAIGIFYQEKCRRLPSEGHGIQSWFYHLIPIVMIVGLIFVIAFDTSHPREQWVKRGIWPFRYGYLENLPKSAMEWKIEWYHKLGFRVFVSGFFLAVVGGLVFPRRGRPIMPLDWLLLLFSALWFVWLFRSIHSLPGIPQRFLLATAYIWFWHQLGSLRRNPDSSEAVTRASNVMPPS